MKNIFRYILGLSIVLSMFSCQKDLMKDVTDGGWNKERNILSLTLENQFGPADIVRDEFETTVTVSVNNNGLNLAAVKIEELVLSYDAEANIAEGGTLNFDNVENKAEITVTSAAGEDLVWTVIVQPYDMFYVGNWGIASQTIYIEQEWGSSWNESIDAHFPEAANEFDNSIQIAYEGYENGRTYGTIVNSAGADGEYGTYFTDGVDITSKIRHLIPAGESTWQMDLATNTMYIFHDDTTSEATVTKEADGSVKLVFTLVYKVEDPFWDYGEHDNYLSWSKQYDVVLSAAK